MTNNRKQAYDIYVNTLKMGVIKAAEAVLFEDNQILRRFGFRYTSNYLAHPNAFSLDPRQLPLATKEFDLYCVGGVPGILDDYLPDDWGKKVLSQLALYRDKKHLSSNSCIDILSLLNSSRIGAIQWVASGNKPRYELGCAIAKMSMAEQAAQSIDQPSAYSGNIDELNLLYLANAGTGVGGARPKALVYDTTGAYLAKFNRLSGDDYNNAKVELACLRMAQAAGLEVPLGKVRAGINHREVLLLNRFDIDTSGVNTARHHLITANALLKDPSSQRDRGSVFRYDDLVDLIRRHSIQPEKDLEQLLGMMLFNRSINNNDSHERNFSFINIDGQYQLSPAYDMVPSLINGAYPVAGFQYSPLPPLPSEVSQHGKIFGLSKTKVKQIAEQVAVAVQDWRHWAEQCDVNEKEINKIATVLKV